MKKTVFVEGMNCGHCSAAVEKALLEIPGVQTARVDLAAKKAECEVDAAVADSTLRKAVEDAGYEVKKIE